MLASATGVPCMGLRSHPSNLIRVIPAKGGECWFRRCLTIAGSDSGGGAGIQADLKAFAAAGCHGMCAIVALTAQNTTGVTRVHELPPDFVRAQLEAVFDDIGVDAAKTGMLFSAPADRGGRGLARRAPCAARRRPGDGRELGRAAAARRTPSQTLVERLFPLATVVTPNLPEAEALAGAGTQARARRAAATSWARRPRSSPAGTATSRSTTSSTASGTSRSPSPRHDVAATHGAGCTHSATLAALLARGQRPRGSRARRSRGRLARRRATDSPRSEPATARSTSSDLRGAA